MRLPGDFLSRFLAKGDGAKAEQRVQPEPDSEKKQETRVAQRRGKRRGPTVEVLHTVP